MWSYSSRSAVVGLGILRDDDIYAWSKASGDHGSIGVLGESFSRATPMSASDDITSSIALRNGEGVMPVPAGEGGHGETAGGV
jgi:hypothetical protein